jgi:hypothetical protein
VNVPKLKANLFDGVGTVAFSEGFNSEARLTKLDMLKDWTRALQAQYERVLSEPE